MINQQQRFWFLPWLLFFVAITWLWILLSTIQPGVFFSGDGGLKYLMVRQIAVGGDFAGLQLDSPAWVSEIWNQGFYPFKEPFVYDLPPGKLVAFPPLFQIMNAWMYRLFGFNGLYVIPAASIISFWYLFLRLMQRSGFSSLVQAVAFCLLAFCSPVTIYGAIYWEHSLALLLSFGAVYYLSTSTISRIEFILCGAMAGLSAWFRPEALLFAVIVLGLTALNYRSMKAKSPLYFILSCVCFVLAFFIFNKINYGSLLGIHANQVLNGQAGTTESPGNFIILLHMYARFIIYFPAILLVVALIAYRYKLKMVLPPSVIVLVSSLVIFLAIVPFIVPNAGGKQWGPRYLLPAIPAVIMVMAMLFDPFKHLFLKRMFITVIAVICLYSAYLNVYLGYQTLRNDYSGRVKPALEFLARSNTQVVVIQNQFIVQEFATQFTQKTFFLAEKQQDFDRLMLFLKSNNIRRVLYISHDENFERRPINLVNQNPRLLKIGDYYLAEYPVN